MLTTPSTAFVGSPLFVDSIGIAWNARYRYDEPSTRTSGLSLIRVLVVGRLGLAGWGLYAFDGARVARQDQRALLAATAGSCGEHRRENCEPGASRSEERRVGEECRAGGPADGFK